MRYLSVGLVLLGLLDHDKEVVLIRGNHEIVLLALHSQESEVI
jgi:hypothetical protein